MTLRMAHQEVGDQETGVADEVTDQVAVAADGVTDVMFGAWNDVSTGC